MNIKVDQLTKSGHVYLVVKNSMPKDIGPQYKPDDPFKAAARLHQSSYRAKILKVDYSEYGNRLTDADAHALLNYYDGLGVREALRKRYPYYSRRRDADMLRSEHIPFNMLAPLAERPGLMQTVLKEAFGVDLEGPFKMKLEWAPQPAERYLGDLTSFDTYIEGTDALGESVGIGIEVKYTERGYRIGASESRRLADDNSTYWVTTRESGQFTGGGNAQLTGDDLRQIWRNHLLGLAMVQAGDISRFVSVTLYPEGNEHFTASLAKYKNHLTDAAQSHVHGCTFEQFIDCLNGERDIEEWKSYLKARYLFKRRTD